MTSPTGKQSRHSDGSPYFRIAETRATLAWRRPRLACICLSRPYRDAHLGEVSRERKDLSARAGGFTLLEILLVVGILGLIFTSMVFSLRGAWKAEHGRREAQKVTLAWMKARSYAWREGREWTMTYDSTEALLHVAPSDISTVDSDGDAETSLAFTLDLDPRVRLLSEQQEDELEPVRFLPNGRVQHASLLVVGAGGDAWRVKTDWSGRPLMEPSSLSSK